MVTSLLTTDTVALLPRQCRACQPKPSCPDYATAAPTMQQNTHHLHHPTPPPTPQQRPTNTAALPLLPSQPNSRCCAAPQTTPWHACHCRGHSPSPPPPQPTTINSPTPPQKHHPDNTTAHRLPLSRPDNTAACPALPTAAATLPPRRRPTNTATRPPPLPPQQLRHVRVALPLPRQYSGHTHHCHSCSPSPPPSPANATSKTTPGPGQRSSMPTAGLLP